MKVIKILFALLVSNSAMLIANEPQFINKLNSDAMAGNATAQCNLGVSYMEVGRSRKDYAEAVKWFRKSAEQGNAQAQTNLV
jgi:TPR repeat protein